MANTQSKCPGGYWRPTMEHSVLTMKESGFKGTEDQIIYNTLDSTGSFGQVTIELKAYLEYDAITNVVTDHP